LCEDFNKLNLRIVTNTEATEMEVGSNLLQEIWKGQVEDEKIQEIKCNIKEEKSHGIAESSVRIRFHLGNCGSTDQGGSLYTCQEHLVWTTTSRVVYVRDSLSAWSAKEDYV
jgi:hypothetical protein